MLLARAILDLRTLTFKVRLLGKQITFASLLAPAAQAGSDQKAAYAAQHRRLKKMASLGRISSWAAFEVQQGYQ